MAEKQATITKIAAFDKLAVISLETDGQKWEAKTWKSDAFFADLVEGSVIKLAVEKKPNYKDASQIEVWITSVNGKAAKASKGGGGGGYKAPPKDEAAIAAQTILKEAAECARAGLAVDTKKDLAALTEAYCASFTDSYVTAYQKLKGVMQ